jgi:NitT/TauT family transport system substrate-binding protein
MRRCAAALAAALSLVLLAGCGSAAARPATGPDGVTDLTVAAVPAEGAAGLYIAQDDGLFKKAGLHVTIEPTENPEAVIPAMLHGSVQVLSGQYQTYIAATAAGIADMRIIAAGYALGPHVQEIMIGPKSAIRSPAQLKGATIAVNALDSVTTDLLYTALQPYRISPSQVHVVTIGFPAMGAALAAHRVNAIYEVEPYVTEASQKFGDQDLDDIDSGPAQGFPVNGYGALASWAASNPHAAKAFVKAIDEGNLIASTNLAAREHALQTSLHLSPNVVDVMAAGTYPTTLDPVQIQRAVSMMRQFGQLAHPFTAASICGA